MMHGNTFIILLQKILFIVIPNPMSVFVFVPR